MTSSSADLRKKSPVNRQRNAFRAAVLLLVAIGFDLVLSFRLGFQSGDWQLFARGGVVVVFGAVTIYSIRLIRRNRVKAGVWAIIWSFLAAMLVTTSLVADFGIISGLIEVFIVAIIASYTLSPEQVGRAIAVSVAAAVVSVTIDALDPVFSLPAPDTFRQALPIWAAVIILLNAGLILRQFMSFPLRGKLITVLVGMTAVTVTIIGGFFLYTLRTNLRQQVVINQIHDSSVKETAVQTFLENARTDILFLSQSRSMDQYLQAVNEGDAGQAAETLDVLAADFRTFAQNRFIYDQIRFLDVTGQEIVRINRAQGGFSVSAPENLHNKADRYYFQNSIDLAPGDVYVSPVDLNVEHGQVERPYKPTIRYGTPVYQGDQLAGIIVVNVLAEQFLELLGGGESPSFLVDIDGYYLYHPNPNKRWGRDLGTGYTVVQDYPELASGLFSGKPGSFETEDQFFAYTPISLPGDSSPRWYLVSFRPTEKLFAPVTQTQNTALLLLAGAMLAAAGIAVLASQVLAKPLMMVTRAAERMAAGDWDTRVIIDRQDEIGTLAQAFNVMSDHVQGAVEQLEARVAARTRDLALAAEVGQSISQVRDLPALLADAVEMIRSRFDLYYTQIYLADEAGRTLILKEGTGKAGRELAARSHRLPLAPGSINGLAASQKRPVVVPDTTASETFFANPLLPDARSEMAVPLLLGDRVVGVLDLQSSRPNSLTEEIVPAFEALAGQLAVAIENAALFAQTNEARAEIERQAQRLAHAQWIEFLDKAESREYVGYSYENGRVESLLGPLVPVEQDAALLDMPIKISGEQIGTIRLESGAEQPWQPEDASMVASVAQQVAQQLESLRLLSEAERYRIEAEKAMRRLTREGWDAYLETVVSPHAGYSFDQNQVEPLAADEETPASIRQELIVQGEAVGHLAVANVDETDSATEELVTAVARQLSDHIEGLRLIAQTEAALTETAEQARRRALLNEVSEQLNRAETLDTVYNIIADRTSHILPSDRVSLAILNDDDDQFTIMSLAGEGAAVPLGDSQPLAGSVIEKAIRSSAVIVTHDPASTSELSITSSMVAPLITNAGAIGTLNVGSKTAYAYDEDDESMLLQIASILSSVIENKRLFAQAKERAEDLSIINRVAQVVAQQLDPSQMLVTVYQEIHRSMSIDAYFVNLYDANTNQLQYLIMYENGKRFQVPKRELSPNSFTAKVLRGEGSQLVFRTKEEAQAIAKHRIGAFTGDMSADAAVTASLIFIPLYIGKKVAGVLSVQSYQFNAYDESDVALLTGIANHVAVSLENARLFAEVEERAQELAVINQVAEVVSQQLELKQLFAVVHEQIQRAIPSDAFFVATFDAEKDMVYFPYLFDEDQIYEVEPIEADPAIEVAQVIKTGEPILKNYTPAEQRQEQKTNNTLMATDKAPSGMIFVPLRVGSQIVGALSVQNYKFHVYDESDVTLLSGIANHVALALENVRLFTEAQRRAEREALINAISQKIQTAPTVQSAMQTAVAELGQALKLKKAAVSLTVDKQVNGRNQA